MTVDVTSIDKALKKWWSSITLNLIQEVRSEIIRKQLIYTGRMLGSIRVEWVKPKKICRVVVDVPYARLQERGAKSVKARYGDIYRWVRAVKGERGEQAERAAWAIITSLRKRGLKGKYFVRSAVRRFLRRFGR